MSDPEDRSTPKLMVNTANVRLLAEWYRSANPALLAEDIEWELAENFLGGGTVRSRQAVFSEVFGRIAAAFQPWAAFVEAIYDAGDGQSVFATGHYRGVARATGRPVVAAFVHLWRVRQGQLAFARQITDTLALDRVQRP